MFILRMILSRPLSFVKNVVEWLKSLFLGGKNSIIVRLGLIKIALLHFWKQRFTVISLTWLLDL